MFGAASGKKLKAAQSTSTKNQALTPVGDQAPEIDG
jgi:hypothetical protein